jgi:flagellar basal-body rod protein FlgF
VPKRELRVFPFATRSFIKGESRPVGNSAKSRASFKTARHSKRHTSLDAILDLLHLSSSFLRHLRNGAAIAFHEREDFRFQMDPLLISAASGMKARMESLDMLANNIANSGTAGFKSDREFYNLYEQQLPVIENQWTDFSQGSLVQTGNPLNLALSGKGMFALTSPSGTVFTRNGDFQISKSNQLVSGDGYTLRNTLDNGNPITVDPTQSIDILKDGTVQQAGQTVGQIEVDNPDSNPLALAKLGNSNFIMSTQTALTPAQGTDVLQGQLEQSNVPVSETAVKLIGVMRQFEMLQKAITTGTDMNRRAIEEVAKVS